LSNRSESDLEFIEANDMATTTTRTTTAVNGDRTMPQVRIHLTTRNSDIELPQGTGPILVSTGKQ